MTSQARTFLFNGDNKQYEVKNAFGARTARYYYDGEGKRVKKKVYDPNYPSVVSEETIFVYSSGKLVAEYSTVTPPATPTVNYTTTDHLGSPRVITDAIGQVTSRRDFLPFGEEVTINVGARSTALKYGSSDDKVRQKFTGYQKDTETSLDFAEARMYDNRFGRFTAVDPLLASGRSANPQTFNRYIYCLNSPLTCIDPSGLIPDFWAFRNRDGGTEWKHFKSQEELDKWNKSGEGTDFCKQYPSSCTPYSVWTGGKWVLWADRTGASLNDDGTMTSFSLAGYGDEGQWNQLVDDWYAGKGLSEAWQRAFEVAKESTGRTGLSSLHDLTITPITGDSFGQTLNNLRQEKFVQALPFVFAQLSIETSLFRSVSNGVRMDGLTSEFRLQRKHFSGTNVSNPHVFVNKSTFSKVESTIFDRGVFTGITQQGSRAWARFGVQFDGPIGYRLGQDGSRTALTYGEMKLDLNTGLYHIIPRTRSR